MIHFKNLLLVIGLILLASCSFFNGKTAELSLSSNPFGADIFIEGRYFGRTPKVLKLKPAELRITLMKNGYERVELKTSYWGAVRTSADGKVSSDGKRCLLDMATAIFFFNAFSERCSDFKQKSYYVNLVPIR